jgi:hypothetical protein
MPTQPEKPEKANIKLENSPLKLKVCNLSECEARCCYDGVYLNRDEGELITALVKIFPDLFPELPQPFIVYSEWGDDLKGNKTATVPYKPNNPAYPAHFTQTRCAFLTDNHLCSLQLAGVKLGFHKWTFKPRACWEFPLEYQQDTIIPPPLPDEPDPSYLDESYPGYVKFTPCGMHNPSGDAWHETLKEEISYIAENPADPSWHRFGMTLDEIIQLARERYQTQKETIDSE